MKNILAVFFLLSISTIINAQNGDYFETAKGTLVLKPCVNFSTISVKLPGGEASTADLRIGYGLGLEYWQKVANVVFVSGGLHYNSFGYKSVRTNYLNVPVLLNYISKSQTLVLGAGVYGGYGLSGKYKVISSGWQKLNFGEGATDNRSRSDFGYVIHAGLNIIGLLSSYAYIGAKDLTPSGRHSSTEPTRKMFSWVISYSIPLKELMGK